MGLDDDLNSVCRARYKTEIKRALEELDQPLADKLLAALRDPEHYSAGDLAAVLTKNGYQAGRSAVQTWRGNDKAQHPDFYEGQKVRGSQGGRSAARR